MLKPRIITAAILAFFVLVTGIRHFTFSLASAKTDSELDLLNQMETNFPLLPWIERTDYDTHLRAMPIVTPSREVVVVDVNERSLKEIGQFPFARSVYAKLLRNLESYGARVAAFDITFPERERNDASSALRALREDLATGEGRSSRAIRLLDARIAAQNGDAVFAQAIRSSRMPIILGFAFTPQERAELAPLAPKTWELMQRQSVRRVQVADNSLLHKMVHRRPVLPHDGLLAALPGHSSIGVFTSDPDEDSVIRRAVGVLSYNGMIFPSLAVRAVAAYLGVNPVVVGENGYHIRDEEQSGKLDVPLLPSGSYLLRYYGGASQQPASPADTENAGYFPYIEFSDMVSDDPATQARMKSQVAGKIVFVGVTSVGLKDIRANPFTKDFPGVEVHATFASNMLTGTYLVRDQRYFFFGYAFILALGIVASLLVYRLHPLLALGLAAGLLIAFQLACQRLFFDQGLVVPTFVPSLAALAVLFGGVLYRYFTEAREKRMVRTAFSRYVSGPVVEEILRDQSKLKLGGQKKVLTVMFCDLVGFTKMSEHMDAERLTLLLNEYFTRMTRIILANRGTLDKYMGDAVMCFWGAPLDIPDHARLACKTALEMTDELARINTEWKEKYGVSIGLRIGIHTGEMNVGNMGSEQVFSYTVMGDNVNLGSRLEGVNNVYGTTIMVSTATAAAAGKEFLLRTLDRVRVKGKEDAVEIAELLGFNRGPSPEWVESFTKGVRAYQKGDWEEAERSFGRCLELKPGDGPSRTFLERVSDLKANPPRDWDGTWTLSSK